MPRTKEQFEEIRKEKSAHIRQVALELFANYGYHLTSISKIAKAANISKGLLYNYFESKEALIKAILNEGMDESYASFDSNHDGILTSDEFEFFVHQNFELIKSKKAFYKLFYTILMQPDVQELINHESLAVAARVQKQTYDYFEKRFDDPETEMLIYSSLLKGLNIQFLFNDGYFNDEQMEKAILRIIDLYKKEEK
ncbi:MAG: TetR/AcrR family transcriptional regulator [Salinivirgaceae bacterium]|jgi:AcrR family transcriptional regulator|nr:TetR/AcrR family transcriptional regulator [Salinivirgaceae bacterium]